MFDRESSSSGSRAVDKYNSESFESPESSETAKSKKPPTVFRSNNTPFVQVSKDKIIYFNKCYAV